MYILVIRLQSKTQYEKFNLFLLVLKLIMIFVGWILILMSLSILLRQGTNKELRSLAMRRQVIFLFLFVFWHTMFSIFFYDSNLLKKINLSQHAIRFISIYLQVIGIPSSIMRLSEPYVWFSLKQSANRLKLFLQFGCKMPEEVSAIQNRKRSKKDKELKQRMQEASICSFLNSAMNIEYVYMILQGIDKLMENQQLMDSISRRQNQLLNAQYEAMQNDSQNSNHNVDIDELVKNKLLR